MDLSTLADNDEDEVDEEFQSLFSQLSNDDEEVTLEDYLTFDDNLSTSVGQINTNLEDWHETAREEVIRDVVSEREFSTNSSSDDESDDNDND